MPKQDEHQQQQPNDLRSYDPYLISYHEDTNSFTYTDPWVEITHEDINNSNFNDNNLEHHDSTTSPSPPVTTTSSYASEVNNLEVSTSSSAHHEDLNYNNYSDKLITENHQPPASPAVIEKVVEHMTEEVSCHSLSLSLPHLFAYTNDMKLSVHSSFKTISFHVIGF